MDHRLKLDGRNRGRGRWLITAGGLLSACLWANGLFSQEPAGEHNDSDQREIPNTQVLEIPMTPPAEALRRLQLPPGFQATLFASEPTIHQPIAAAWDGRGRLWVVECYTYSDRQENYNTALQDRVLILEDTDHDGQLDRKSVFWDQGSKLTGIEIGLGGVWLTSAPNLLFLPDADRDDLPDGPPQVMLDGFEGDVIRHNIVNGLRWGPDGWLYGRHGIQATSHVGRPGATESQRTAINCCIWRYHPDDARFEVVAEGGTNPWGFDYDRHGEMFMINTVIGHLFHVVPGARYRRMYGAHFNPHTYQVIEQTADHFHWDTSEPHTAVTSASGMSAGTDRAGGGHAHTGLMIYQGDNWPEEYRHRLYTANFHGRRINSDAMERQGNSYVGRHGPDIIHSADPWFRGVELLYGPDGGVFLLDWSDIGECHENDGIHRTSGRIFKLTHGTDTADPPLDLAVASEPQLVSHLFHANQWFARQARLELQQRCRGEAGAALADRLALSLQESYREATGTTDRLAILWTLASIDRASTDWLLDRTGETDEHLRAWAVRLLSDGRRPLSAEIRKRFLEMAAADDSGLVRLYLASALGRLPAEAALALAMPLTQHSEDAADRVQPHLIWFGIEPHLTQYPDAACRVALESKLPLLVENVARRLAAEVAQNPAALDQLLQTVIENAAAESAPAVLRGVALGLRGWQKAAAPRHWARFAELPTLATVEHQAELRRLNLVFGEGLAQAELLKLLTDSEQPVSARRQAIETLAELRPDDALFDQLKRLIRDKSFSNTVIRALEAFDRPQVPQLILDRYRQLDPAGQRLAVDVLTSRASWARRLLEAVAEGRIPVALVTASHARQIENFSDPQLTALLGQHWGTLRKTPAERLQSIDRWRELLQNTPLDQVSRERGRELFERNCASCHVLFGAGGAIGPDLTGSDRRNLNYLLENVVDPSGSVAQSYRTAILEMRDGRLLTGIPLEEQPRTLVLQTKDQRLTLDRTEIESFQQTNQSLMPDGLLDNLSRQDVLDLFAYLQQ